MSERIFFYIDGFNLYYGIRDRGRKVPCQKDHNKWRPTKTSKYKWLDISKLCHLLMSTGEISKIKYFTARIRGEAEKEQRQDNYLKLLSSSHEVEIIEGNFLQSHVFMRRASPPNSVVNVIKNEEKGTDVNIASHMLIDGFRNEYDIAALITNDSDFAYTVRFIKNGMNKKVLIFNPQHRPSKTLSDITEVKSIFDNTLKNAQFPQTVYLPDGQSLSRPNSWR